MTHSGTALVDPYKIFDKITLSPGKRVADLGCGRTGHFVFPAAKTVGERGIVYAVDVVKDVLESIKSMARDEGYDNVHVVWSDIELRGKTPIPDKTLDACFMMNVLFLLKNKAGAIKEAARMLAKDGRLVITDWAKQIGLLGPKPEAMVLPQQAIELAKQEGLELVEKIDWDYNYSLVFKKMV
ncbi:MAG: methyltransferase domain-containing protein [Patescibacteria group bacterium]